MTGHVVSRPMRVGVTLLLLSASGRSALGQTRLDILFESPPFLTRIDGDPLYRHIEGTDLERISSDGP